MRYCLLTIAFLLTSLSPAGAARPAAEETANHPDGSLHFRVRLNAKGRRDGPYQAYFPGGKKLREKSTYAAGELHGVRQLYDEDKTLLAEETWFNGRLVFPKSPKLIEAARRQIAKDAEAAVAAMGKPTNPKAPNPKAVARALARHNSYRYVCGVPHDVTVNDEYVNLCQHAAEILVKIGRIDHAPPRPPGVGDEFYRLAAEGCIKSNLCPNGDILVSVDDYMADDDPGGNLNGLGHRRWLLNPAMAQTGFGSAGRYSAMYASDEARKDAADFDFIAFPPAGYCPADLFNANWPWHVTVNPAHYDVADDAKAEIFPVDKKLKRAARPLALNHAVINREPFGIANAIIFRPGALEMRGGAVYEVVVTGLRPKGDKPAGISYYVSFCGKK